MKSKSKDSRILVKIIIWLIIALIIIAGFIGVYTQNLNQLTNIIPEYNYGMDIRGNREFNLSVDNSEEEKTVYVDSNGNISGVAKEEEHEETEEEHEHDYIQVDGYTIETRTVKANNEEELSIANYEKTKRIIEKRADILDINEMNIKLDRENGNITIELAENKNTDSNYSILTSKGEFEIIDYQTGLVLMDNSDIVRATPVSNQSATGNYEVYLQIEFTKEATEILKSISQKYIEYENAETGETTIDYVSFELDGSSIYQTYFSEEWTSNYIYIPIVRTISTQEELTDAYMSASNVATIINTGKLPVKYSLTSNSFVKSAITKENIQKFQYSIYIVLVAIIGIFIIKFKLNGLKLGIANIGFVGLYSIILRVLMVNISLSGIVAIAFIIVLNMIFYFLLLNKKEEFNNIFFKFNTLIIPIIVIALVFTLTNNIQTLSIGMTTFWGIIAYEIYNFLFVKNLLK